MQKAAYVLISPAFIRDFTVCVFCLREGSLGLIIKLGYEAKSVEGTVSNRTQVANRNGLNIHFLSWYFD